MRTADAKRELHSGAFLMAEYDEDGLLKYRISTRGGCDATPSGATHRGLKAHREPRLPFRCGANAILADRGVG